MLVFSFGFSEIVDVETLVVASLSCKVDSSTDNASFIKVSSWEEILVLSLAEVIILVSLPSRELFTWLQHILAFSIIFL